MARKKSRKSGRKTLNNENKNKRRWFVNATGWGFELSLGSGTHQTVGSKAKRGLSSSSDSKYFMASQSITTITAETLYWFNAMAGVVQGVTGATRIGDKVFLENLSLRLMLSSGNGTAVDYPCSVRILLVASTQQFATTTFTSGSLTNANFFMLPLNSPYSIASVCDPRLCRVLCDDTYTLQGTVAGKGSMVMVNADCQANAWFEYQPTTNVGVVSNLFWLVLGSQMSATAGTTVIGTVQGSSLVVFKDE